MLASYCLDGQDVEDMKVEYLVSWQDWWQGQVLARASNGGLYELS